MSKVNAILIFGPPGSGKGTLSSVLSIHEKFLHLSSGNLFRSLNPASSLGKSLQSYLKKGELIPDGLTIEICRTHMNLLIKNQSFDKKKQIFLLDGLPRTVGQAKELSKFVNVVRIINLSLLDKNELVSRLKKRALKEKRTDDLNEAVIENRLNEYEEKTKSVLSFYSKELIVPINAQGDPLTVLKEVLDKTLKILV